MSSGRLCFIHGAFNSDGSGWEHLRPRLEGGYDRVFKHEYGWVGPITTRRRSRRAGEALTEKLEPGDDVVAFSNGALVTHEALAAGAECRRVVLIQPALSKDASFADFDVERVCVLHNRRDYIVQSSRLVGFLSPVSIVAGHGWGAMGYYGPTADDPGPVKALDTLSEGLAEPYGGHFGWRHKQFWADVIRDLLREP